MEHNFTCTLEGPESVMKFSHQRLESPPPKPPRRRYSEQLSIPPLGAYPTIKKFGENHRYDSVLKRYTPKPGYQSLPANLTSDVLTECEDTSNIVSCFNLSTQLQHSKENEFQLKFFPDNFKAHEDSSKQSCGSNKFPSKEKLQSVISEKSKDYLFSMHQLENFSPTTADTFYRTPSNDTKMSKTDIFSRDNLKSFHKECHRRHHSDPLISHITLQNENSGIFNHKLCYDNLFSNKKDYKYCDAADSCCRKNYYIMQEMKILKEINDKLWHQLFSSQTQLENAKKKMYNESADVTISGLLSSIYYAQKKKDSVMEERLKLALDERDAAVYELEELIHILSKQFSYADGEKEIDRDVKELLGEMGCITNPSKFLKYQRMLLSQIQNFKESKQEFFSLKLNQTVIERDNAFQKVKILEEEIKDMKHCFDLWHSDNKCWEFTMFDVISRVMHQRDSLLSKGGNIFNMANDVYRPLATNKVDSSEHQDVISYEPQPKTYELLKSHPSKPISDKQQHAVKTCEDVIKLKEEILILNKLLDGEKKKREHTEEKCFKLERLIHILRKKLNGQNIGVPV